MQLFVTGLSHKTAPVSVRERLAFVTDELEGRLKQAVTLPGVREAAIVSTCNRMEIYGAFSDEEEAQQSIRGLLVEALGPDSVDSQALLGQHLYRRVRRDAVHHLFRVTASLDSLVIGEPQILGQVKEAFELARKVGTAGPLLGGVFQHAFRVARKVRRETAIAEQKVSVSSVAVDLARKFFGGFEGHEVLLVGAGKMADLAALVLRREGANLRCINRSQARAEELATRLGGQAVPWTGLGDALGKADIVISSTAARVPVLSRAQVQEARRHRHGRPLILIDIAVPRDVEPSVASLDGVYLYDIDDLQKVVDENKEDRRQEGSRAEALIEAELARFLSADQSRAAGPTIAALRSRCLGIARAEADKVVGNLGAAADERTRRAVQAMAESIVAKILHAPSVALKKEAAGGGDGPDLIEAVHKLHDLPPVQPVASAEPEDQDDQGDGGDAGGGGPGPASGDVKKASRP